MPPTTGAVPPGRRELQHPKKLQGKLAADAFRLQDDYNLELFLTSQGSPVEHGATHSVGKSDPLAAATTVPKLVLAGTTPTIGVGPSYMREDAQLAASTGVAVDLGEANAEGAGTTLARAAHVHKLLVRAAKAGVTTGTRKRLNFTDSATLTFTLTDDAGNDEIDISGTVIAAPTHNLLSATHPDTTPASPVRGDLILGVAGPSWSKLAIGLAGRYLRSDGTDPSWVQIAASDIASGILALARGGTGSDLSGTGGAGFFIKQSSVGGNLTSAALVLGDISDGLITYAKLQDVSAASRLLGRGDSGAGDVQEIILGTNLSMSGTTLNAAGGGGGAPTTAEYLVGALDGTLSAERLVTDTATVAWDLTVGGQAKANVPDDGITFAKIQNITTARLLGRATALSGDIEEIPVGAPLTLSAIGGLDFDETVALGNNARVTIRKNTGADIGTRRRLNLIEGSNVTFTIADDAGSEEVDITINSSAGAGSGVTLSSATVNLGANPRTDGSFDISGVGFTVGKPVVVIHAAGPGGALDDDKVLARGVVETTTRIKVYWNSERVGVSGDHTFDYFVGS